MNKKKKTKKRFDYKRLLFFVLIGVNVDSLISCIIVLLHKPKNSPDTPIVIDYLGMAKEMNNSLLSIVNDNIDELGKVDPSYDVNKILSLSIDHIEGIIYGSAINDNYVDSFAISYHKDKVIYEEIISKAYTNVSVSIYTIDNEVENPLISDSDFINLYANTLNYKIGKDVSPTYRTISCTFIGKHSELYSISPYIYEIGNFKFNEIPSKYISIYKDDDSNQYKYIYLLLKGINE